MSESCRPEDYALHAFDKLRYGDTDRQGHVNNAVYATLFETGRVELLYDGAGPVRESVPSSSRGSASISSRDALAGPAAARFVAGLHRLFVWLPAAQRRCAARGRHRVVPVSEGPILPESATSENTRFQK